MPGKRQQLETEVDVEAEAGPASKRVKHSHERLGLASLDGLSLDSSPLQDKQKIKTEHVVARDYSPSIRIIEPTDEDGEFPRREMVIDLTRDTPSPESASPQRDVSPVDAYDACFGMVSLAGIFFLYTQWSSHFSALCKGYLRPRCQRTS